MRAAEKRRPLTLGQLSGKQAFPFIEAYEAVIALGREFERHILLAHQAREAIRLQRQSLNHTARWTVLGIAAGIVVTMVAKLPVVVGWFQAMLARH